jgi:hypothetical protein
MKRQRRRARVRGWLDMARAMGIQDPLEQALPDGFVYLIDTDGSYLTDSDGAFLIERIA